MAQVTRHLSHVVMCRIRVDVQPTMRYFGLVLDLRYNLSIHIERLALKNRGI